MEGIGAFLPLILIFGVFYILLIRPQQKKVKQHREMLNNLKRGDKIITSGGIIGSINKVNENRRVMNISILTNVVNYRPPNNRKPEPSEINRYSEFSHFISSYRILSLISKI